MAILEKIRKRSIALIVVIGMSLFAFVISDLLSKNTGANITSETVAGEVGSEPIPISSFRNRVKNVLDSYKTQGYNISNQQAVNFAWRDAVSEKIFEQELEKLAIEIDPSDIFVLAEPLFVNNALFLDEQGKYSPEKVKEYVNDLRVTNPTAYLNWKNEEERILRNGKIKQYNTMVFSGLNATKLEGKNRYISEVERVSVEYVKTPYSSVSDSLIKITDKDVEDHIKANPKEYEQEASRDLQYVVFKEEASSKDIEAIKQELSKYLNSFEEFNHSAEETEKIPSFSETNDVKAYVNNYSDQPFNDQYLFKTDLKTFAEELFALKTKAIIGPYKDADYFKISRVISRKQFSDSVKVSHISVPLVGTTGLSKTKQEARKSADSIFRLVKNDKKKFGNIAEQQNADNSKTKKGDLGWITYNSAFKSYNKEFNDYIFNNNVGSTGIVETPYGYEILYIEDQGAKKQAIQIASISKKIVPSEETINLIFARSTQFEMDVANGKISFEQAAKRDSVEVFKAEKLNVLDAFVNTLEQRSIVQWAFNEQTGINDIKRFNVNNDNVITQLVKKVEKGLMSVEDARISATSVLSKEKKAAIIIEKYKEQNLMDIAKAEGVTVQTANDISIKNPSVTGVGREPKLVGAAYATEKDKESGFIVGDSGVFKIKVLSHTYGPGIENYLSYEKSQKTFYKSKANNVFGVLEDAYEIEDNRYLFY